MKKTYLYFPAVMVMTALVLPLAWGQRGARNYNPSTEATVQGTVEEVTQATRGQGWGGTHLTLKSDQGTVDVHLGPTRFLEANKFTAAKGDQLKVTGSKIQYEGHDTLIAREVTKGGRTLTLRNAQGIPAWSGGRWRN